jgi:Rnl2 family RNA ligase
LTDWPFVSYDKIPERLELDEISHRASAKVAWVVTEKIHGANFCVLTDGNEVRAAKRKALLEEGEEFFGYARVLERVREPVRRLFAALKPDHPEAQVVSIYGELFGGAYPHPDVPAVEGVEPVQPGIYYSPDIQWCAFDIAIWDGERTRYIDYDQAIRRLGAVEIFFAAPLLVGKYEEAIAYPIEFESRVPMRLGLPAIPGNRAEGVVIKPVKSIYIGGEKGPFRPAVKRKTEAFVEDARRKPGQAPRGGGLAGELPALFNQERLRSAVSKIGRVRRGDARRRAQLRRMLVEDVLDTLAEDRRWEALAQADRRELQSAVERSADLLLDEADRRGWLEK